VLAQAAAESPREIVIATRASMRLTANPGCVDGSRHHVAVDIELAPQAASITSQDFVERLAVARRR
jgi:enoyl-CoA hydratase